MNKKTDKDEGIIRPMKNKTDPEVGPDAMMVMIPSDLDYLVKLNQENNITLFNMGFFKLYQLKDGPNASLTLAGPFLGAPQAVMGMEKIIVLGAKRVWVFGWCGSIAPGLRVGDLVIPTSGISEEGTSQHYPIGKKPLTTDKKLNWRLEEALKKGGESFRKGAVWTTDAPYRETASKVKEFQDRGVLTVEMEMSALMTLAIYRKVKLAGLLVVSDELFELKWRPGFSSPELGKRLRSAGEILLNLVKSPNSI